MRIMLTCAMMLSVVGPAMAFDLGNQRPVKPEINYPQNIPDPDRQGGDTILDAVYVELPVVDMAGTTAGYVDDYDEVCPYSNSTSPDVVYTFTPAADTAVDIDMLGSTYDTKIYVYDVNLTLIACNDDFYPDYVSKLENVALMGGAQYFLVIDGYGGDAGDYELNIVEYEPCVLTCWDNAVLEGEPPLVDGYEDSYNGGCNSPEFGYPFGVIEFQIFCGVSGWYVSADGSNSRDTDWFELVVPLDHHGQIIGDAEQFTYMFELGPQDCDDVAVMQSVVIGPCSEGTLTIPFDPGSTMWLWVGPTTFEGPVNEYDYTLFIPAGLATETHSWTAVKALFD